MNPILKLIGEAEDLWSDYDSGEDAIGFMMTPEEAYMRARELGRGNAPEELERIIATSALQSYLYAQDVLGGRFHLGEPSIAKDPELAFRYANDILTTGAFIQGSNRFPLGEFAIATSAQYSYLYARNIIANGDFVPGSYAFPIGEPAIATSGFYSYWYAANVLNKRFPAGEEAIKAASPGNWRAYKEQFILP